MIRKEKSARRKKKSITRNLKTFYESEFILTTKCRDPALGARYLFFKRTCLIRLILAKRFFYIGTI
jgi:hypothetical protein